MSSIGEIIGIDKRYDAVCLAVLLLPEEMENPEEMFEHRIGDKVRMIGKEPDDNVPFHDVRP